MSKFLLDITMFFIIGFYCHLPIGYFIIVTGYVTIKNLEEE